MYKEVPWRWGKGRGWVSQRIMRTPELRLIFELNNHLYLKINKSKYIKYKRVIPIAGAELLNKTELENIIINNNSNDTTYWASIMCLVTRLCARCFLPPDDRTADSVKCQRHRVRSGRAASWVQIRCSCCPPMRKPWLAHAWVQNSLMNQGKWRNKRSQGQGPGLEPFLKFPTWDVRNTEI